MSHGIDFSTIIENPHLVQLKKLFSVNRHNLRAIFPSNVTIITLDNTATISFPPHSFWVMWDGDSVLNISYRNDQIGWSVFANEHSFDYTYFGDYTLSARYIDGVLVEAILRDARMGTLRIRPNIIEWDNGNQYYVFVGGKLTRMANEYLAVEFIGDCAPKHYVARKNNSHCDDAPARYTWKVDDDVHNIIAEYAYMLHGKILLDEFLISGKKLRRCLYDMLPLPIFEEVSKYIALNDVCGDKCVYHYHCHDQE